MQDTCPAPPVQSSVQRPASTLACRHAKLSTCDDQTWVGPGVGRGTGAGAGYVPLAWIYYGMPAGVFFALARAWLDLPWALHSVPFPSLHLSVFPMSICLLPPAPSFSSSSSSFSFFSPSLVAPCTCLLPVAASRPKALLINHLCPYRSSSLCKWRHATIMGEGIALTMHAPAVLPSSMSSWPFLPLPSRWREIGKRACLEDVSRSDGHVFFFRCHQCCLCLGPRTGARLG